MLRIFDARGRMGRREFLRVGGLGLGGLAMADILGAVAKGSAPASKLLRGKSVVFCFMHGGPSQVETFDPKMTAPIGTRSATGEIATKLPGITFGGTFPKLAERADRLAIVRSFTTGDANHDIKPIVGRDTGGANIGAIYARVAGANHPQNGMPLNCALFPQAVNPMAQPAQVGFGRFDSAGALGGAFAPFVPGADGALQRDMTLKLAPDRLDDRRTLLSGLDQVRFQLQRAGALESLDYVRQQAYTTLLSGVAKAFDLSQEDPATIARYDTAPLVTPDQINRKWNNYKFYVDNAQTLGKLMLLARRLCEHGAGFVTVTTNFVWDNHADSNNAGVHEGMQYCGLPFDHAISAFMDDVRERGLEDDILLVCCGEMGRTPRIDGNGGRNHWGQLAPLMLAGGGLKMGQVIGQSTRDAAEPQTEPIGNKQLIATVLQTLVDPAELRLVSGMPPAVVRAATEVDPIPGLF